jgi:hypothetical protein
MLVAIFLGLTFSNLAVAKNYCVRWECEGEPTMATLPSTDWAIGCDDVRSSSAQLRMNPTIGPEYAANPVELKGPLDAFLKRWTDSGRSISEVRAKFEKIEYDHIFQKIHRGKGEVGVRPGFRGWYSDYGMAVRPGTTHLNNSAGNSECSRGLM